MLLNFCTWPNRTSFRQQYADILDTNWNQRVMKNNNALKSYEKQIETKELWKKNANGSWMIRNFQTEHLNTTAFLSTLHRQGNKVYPESPCIVYKMIVSCRISRSIFKNKILQKSNNQKRAGLVKHFFPCAFVLCLFSSLTAMHCASSTKCKTALMARWRTATRQVLLSKNMALWLLNFSILIKNTNTSTEWWMCWQDGFSIKWFINFSSSMANSQLSIKN